MAGVKLGRREEPLLQEDTPATEMAGEIGGKKINIGDRREMSRDRERAEEKTTKSCSEKRDNNQNTEDGRLLRPKATATGVGSRNEETSSSKHELGRELPQRLFATDRYPIDGRINSYSKPEYLLDIVEVLDGSTEYEWLRNSCFGKLFDLTVNESCLSGKLVHQFLCRSLVTRKKHELWFVFGGYPIRFSLQEFALLTGLNCAPYPRKIEEKAIEEAEVGEEDYWYTLLGPKESYTIEEVVHMMKKDKRLPAEQRMTGKRKLQLALLVLVEGVLTCNSWQMRATRGVAEMLKDVDQFVKYPWGRKSFDLTLEMVTVGSMVPSPAYLRKKLSLSHTTTHGFTIAIQLLILKTVPELKKLLPTKNRDATFATTTVVKMHKLRTYRNGKIIQVERDKKLKVEWILEDGFPLNNHDFGWQDEENDPQVEYICRRIGNGPEFTIKEWEGGKADFPLITEIMAKTESKDWTKMKLPSKRTTIKVDNVKGRREAEKGSSGGGTMSKQVSGEEIIREFERISNENMAKMQRMFEIERGILKDELYDELIRAVSSGGFVPESNRAPVLPKAKGISAHKSSSKQADENKSKEEHVDVNAILKNIQEACGNSYIGESMREEETMDDNYESRGEHYQSGGKPLEGETLDKTCNNEMGNALQTEEYSEKVADVSGGSGATSMKEGLEIKENSKDQRINGAWQIDEMRITELPDGGEGGCPEVEEIEESVEENGGDAKRNNVSEDAADEEHIGACSRAPNVKGETNTECQEQRQKVFELGEAETEGDENTEAKTEKKENNGKRKMREAVIKNVYTRQRKSQRVRKNPARLGFAKTASEKEKETERVDNLYMPIGRLSDERVKKFIAKLAGQRNKELYVNGYPVKKTFFQELYTPKWHVDSQHIETMLSLVWRRVGATILQQRKTILDPWFSHVLCNEHIRFGKAKSAERFPWNSLLKSYVRGIVTSRAGTMAWIKDVDMIYVPMHWGKSHWVAVIINLQNGNIEILDPLAVHTDNRRLPKIMKPLVDMLPSLIKDVLTAEEISYPPPKTFKFKRESGIYQNNRTGDCGPLTVKFIELHAQGIGLEGITDEVVDEMRMKYAVDVYEEFVGEI